MKKLLPAFSALLIVILIASCSDNGSGVDPEPEFQPKQIGTFLQTSVNDAEYVGFGYSGSKSTYQTVSGVDSVVVEDAIAFGLSFRVDTTEQNPHGQFRYTYSDSNSIGFPEITSVDVELTNNIDSGYPRMDGGSTRIQPGLVTVKDEIFYPCQYESSSINSIYFRYYSTNDQGEDSLNTVVELKASGFVDVLDELRPCN